MSEGWTESPLHRLPLKPVVIALPEMSLAHTLLAMEQMGVGCVYQLDEHDRPERAFCDRRLVMLLSQTNTDTDISIDRLMTPVTKTVHREAPLGEALAAWDGAAGDPLCVVGDAGQAVAVLEPETVLTHLSQWHAEPAARRSGGEATAEAISSVWAEG